MILNQILFYFFALLAIGSAILMVTRRNIVHSAVFLISTLLATAGIFLQLQAEFLFVVQIILYVGGIMVLFIFVIMLVNLDVALRQIQFNRQKYVAAVLTLVLAAQVFFALWVARAGLNLTSPADKMPVRNTEAIGDAIFQRYMLPFEIASVLLLVAMIGAVVMAKLLVTQRRSRNGTNRKQADTLRSLGLRRIGHTVELEDSEQARGMVHAVRHLVEVKEGE